MISSYLKNLENTYGYHGNWEPNGPIRVGSYTCFETGFLEWLKQCFGIGRSPLDVNKKLHSIYDVLSDSLGELKTTKTAMGSMVLSCGVEVNASAGAGNTVITASHTGGFYAVLENMYKNSIDKEELQARLSEKNIMKNMSSAAVVVSTVSAFGTIAIFSRKGAAVSVSGLPAASEGQVFPGVSNLKFNIDYSKEGAILFSSVKKAPLIPFLELYVIQGDVRHGLYGNIRKPSAFELAEFSYNDFLRYYGE